MDGLKERAVGRAKDNVPWMASRRGAWEEPRTPYRGWPVGEGRGKRKRSAIFLESTRKSHRQSKAPLWKHLRDAAEHVWSFSNANN